MAIAYVEGGRLKADGRSLQEFGVNTPDLLIRWLGGAGAVSPQSPWALTPPKERERLLAAFAANGIRFVRFAPFGLRPLTFQRAFIEQRGAFLEAFDSLVASAEAFNLSLIPSLFFSQPQIPPIFGEPLGAFAQPNTRSYALFEEVIATIVPRYKGSKAIALWQFGNEQDSRLGMKVPNYSTDPKMGTPTAWSEADMTPIDYCNIVTRRFHTLVRAYDSAPVPGARVPRATSSGLQGWRYFLSQRRDWKRHIDERLYDDQTDTATVHPYPALGWHTKDNQGLMIYLAMMREELERKGKPLIVGEFGAQRSKNAPDSSGAALEDLMRQIKGAQVQLSLLWNVPVARGTDENWDAGPFAKSSQLWNAFLSGARH